MKRKGRLLDVCLLAILILTFIGVVAFSVLDAYQTHRDNFPQMRAISSEEWDAFHEQMDKINFAMDMRFNLAHDTEAQSGLLQLRIALQRQLRGVDGEMPYMEIAFAPSREEALGFPQTTLVAYPSEITQGIANGIFYFSLIDDGEGEDPLPVSMAFPQDFTQNWRETREFFLHYYNQARLRDIVSHAEAYGERAYLAQLESVHRVLELIHHDPVIFRHILEEQRWVLRIRQTAATLAIFRGETIGFIFLSFDDIAMGLEEYGVDGLFAITRRMALNPGVQPFSDALEEFRAHGPGPHPPLTTLLDFETFLEGEFYPAPVPNRRWDLEELYLTYRTVPNPEALSEIWALGEFINAGGMTGPEFHVEGFPLLQLFNVTREIRERGVEEFLEMVEFSRGLDPGQRRFFHMVRDAFDGRDRS